MPQLLVRQISEEMHLALKARAKQENKSAEAVVREILQRSLIQEESLGFGRRLAAVWQGADTKGMDMEGTRKPYEVINLE